MANHTILIARDGSECDIADSCAPIRDRDGQVIGACWYSAMSLANMRRKRHCAKVKHAIAVCSIRLTKAFASSN